MKFGKLADISMVNFNLPADAAENKLLLNTLTDAVSTFDFYTGCTGWSMPEWKGRWYPRRTKTKDFLEQYGKQFNTIELNTTHYRIPSMEQVRKWCAQVPADFRFCPKLPQTISHSRELGLGGDQLPLFWESLDCFGDQLGACFMQLPPFFDLNRLAQLELFLKTWPKAFPLAVEMRHESWFETPQRVEKWATVFNRHQVAAVMTDVAGRRDVLHQRLTTGMTMIRFVGNGLHDTDYTRIKQWCHRIEEWKGMGLRTIYFFPHQPDNLLAPDMTRFLVEYLHETSTIETRGPLPISSEPQQGEQIRLF